MNPQGNFKKKDGLGPICGRTPESRGRYLWAHQPGSQKKFRRDESGFFAEKWGLFIIVLALLAVGAGGCERRAAKSREEINRIITLTPSTTELVAALGATDKLAGVDDYSSYPPEIVKLPRVGTFLRPNAEAIVRLKPDLVIADDIHTDAAEALRGAGIETLLLQMHALSDLRTAFARLGERLGHPEAARARADEVQAAIDAARRRRRGLGQRVLIVIDREHGGLGNMIAAATGSWMDELVAITGAQNILAGAAVRYPKVSADEILRGRPDVILDVSYAAEPATAVATWRSLSDVPAVANGRIRVLKDPYFLGPSPRVAEALAALEEALAK